eukprot:TRINITY_DN4258_c0_g2_i1.p1 TRINITY_DN4258_c0_g2~~TRINITY_DN4258_c0_g2_i1.p1  ORF type:complete len:549 (+),score=121.50 TRINITY_DN4258_c0_g2_i1:219-1649(+)
MEVWIMIPSALMGGVIGPGGSHVAASRDASKALIHVEKTPPGRQQNMRAISVKGPARNVLKALELLIHSTDQRKPRPRADGGDFPGRMQAASGWGKGDQQLQPWGGGNAGMSWGCGDAGWGCGGCGDSGWGGGDAGWGDGDAGFWNGASFDAGMGMGMGMGAGKGKGKGKGKGQGNEGWDDSWLSMWDPWFFMAAMMDYYNKGSGTGKAAGGYNYKAFRSPQTLEPDAFVTLQDNIDTLMRGVLALQLAGYHADRYFNDGALGKMESQCGGELRQLEKEPCRPPNERVLVIGGPEECLEGLISVVIDRLSNLDARGSESMTMDVNLLLPSIRLGAIIGHQGKIINGIREDSGCRIISDRGTPGDAKGGNTIRLVNLKGLPSQIKQALGIIAGRLIKEGLATGGYTQLPSGDAEPPQPAKRRRVLGPGLRVIIGEQIGLFSGRQGVIVSGTHDGRSRVQMDDGSFEDFDNDYLEVVG